MGSPKAFFRSSKPLDSFNGPLDSSKKPVAPSNIKLDVRDLRARLRLTQRQFAGFFGFSLNTLKHWERGSRKPTGTALVLLSVIHENPRVVMKAVRKARLWRPGMLPGAPPGYGQANYIWDGE